MPRRIADAEIHAEEVKPEETQNGFAAAASGEPGIKDETALPAEPAAPEEVLEAAETLEEAVARKQLKKKE